MSIIKRSEFLAINPARVQNFTKGSIFYKQGEVYALHISKIGKAFKFDNINEAIEFVS